MKTVFASRVGLCCACGVALMFLSAIVTGCGGCQEKPVPEKRPAPRAMAPTAKARAQAKEAKPVAGEFDMDDVADDLGLWAEAEPDYGEAPLVVKFTVESLAVDKIPGAKYTWDFGDGSPRSHEAGPTHTYAKPGEYVAKIVVVDAYGKTGWDDLDIEAYKKGEE